MNFSEKLVKLRKENKMSQEDLAASLDVSRQSVSKWESGQTYPEMDKLLAICKIFNVTLDSLTNDEVDINNTENKDKNVIDSFFSFVKNTYNFIVNNTLLDNTKCFLVMMFTFLALLILKLPVNLLSDKVTNLITSVSQNDFTIFVANFFEFIFDLVDMLSTKLNISVILSERNSNIRTPAIIDTYIANSGLYCLSIIAIIRAINPIPIIFIMSIFILFSPSVLYFFLLFFSNLVFLS